MFVVSGHLYRPLLLSQSWELGGKILGVSLAHLSVSSLVGLHRWRDSLMGKWSDFTMV